MHLKAPILCVPLISKAVKLVANLNVIQCLILHDTGWVHTYRKVTVYRNTVSWQRGWDSWPRNISKAGYAVTLRVFSMCCRYLAIAWKGQQVTAW